MPLPPALQERLKKRGIIKEDLSQPASSSKSTPFLQTDTDYSRSWLGCPNKCNPYHVCGEFCRLFWANGFAEPEKVTEKKRQLMLLKYPKPTGWKEIYDPGTGRHYYWNVDTDEVSWFPPEHPKASVTVSANKLRAILMKTSFRQTPEVARYLYKNPSGVTTLVSDYSNEGVTNEEDTEGEFRRSNLDESDLHGTRGRGGGGKMGRYKPKAQNEPLDPMDPASYSDIPRGGWSSGLETGGEAKTGVDVTASGPLFQSRPYPSPGAILRRNAGIVDKKKK
ncbi:polyglutamine-binding protein 1-like [Paramacrobiotus metropolitanus]|uniref:polyglutamine-binding protein 1-like n=1 Tax=Paramacrobiotus metropolitanus TaxID=2943436 RepID=UPI002445E99F|nr:polyglutamine-binding protein 1-like [Paramacrobiotus metropolitanus]XP_055351382.1 polyglutamine-binding protein 1-like [Paramacrobiotus metropolitanus]